MTDNEYITMMQTDPLYREMPDGSGDRFAGKLAVAAVLAVVLAAVGGLTDARPDQTATTQIEAPWNAAPPAVVVGGESRGDPVAR